MEFEIIKEYEKEDEKSGLLSNKRIRIFARDKFICKHCGAEGVRFVRARFKNDKSKRGTIQVFTQDMKKFLTIDHVLPRFCGGKNGSHNKQTLCDVCNESKGHKLEEENG